MKRIIITLFMSAFLCFLLAGCSSSETAINMPFGSGSIEGKNYTELVSQLESAGFTNVKSEGEQDLIDGFLHNDGDVDKLEIRDGDKIRSSFSTDSKFEPDTEIVVYYHSYPQSNGDGGASNDNSSKGNGNGASDDNSNKSDSTTGHVSEQGSQAKETTPTTPAEPEVLNASNCADLAALLSVSDPCSPDVSAFASGYKDKTIEFDAYIADMQHVEGMKTRFNVLVVAGDYNGSSTGPNFQYHDVNFSQMKVKPDTVDTLMKGTNVHITAKVGSYDANTGLFYLKPVETLVR